jgi:hypothetical protein
MSTTNAAIVPTVPLGSTDRLNVLQVDQQLSLMNGMTAGFGDNDGNNDNPKPLGQQYGTWPYQPTRIGFIRNTFSVQSTNTASNTGLYTLYFMYNPNQITVNWTTNPNQTAPLYMYGPDSSNAAAQVQSNLSSSTAAVPNLANTQTVGFTLWFDRTYDMMYGNGDVGGQGTHAVFSSGDTAAMDDRGVLKDVAALYNLMGTFISDAAVPISTPCEVVFGQNGAGQLFGFTGYITSLQIIYGIFRHDMIPSQCEIDLQMMCTYVTNTVPTAAPATTSPTVSVNPNTGVASVSGSPVGAV